MKKILLVSNFKNLRKKIANFYKGDFDEDLGKEYLLDLVYNNLVNGLCKVVLTADHSKTGHDVVFELERINPFVRVLKAEGYNIDLISIKDF
jgi:hypothetical protein